MDVGVSAIEVAQRVLESEPLLLQKEALVTSFEEPESCGQARLERHVEPGDSRRPLNPREVVNGVPTLAHELEDPTEAIIAGRNFHDGSRVKPARSNPRYEGEVAFPVLLVEWNIEEDVPIRSGLSGQKLLLFCGAMNYGPASHLLLAASRPRGQDLIHSPFDFESLPGRKAVLTRSFDKGWKRRGHDRGLRHTFEG
jgi:hypothetical protein